MDYFVIREEELKKLEGYRAMDNEMVATKEMNQPQRNGLQYHFKKYWCLYAMIIPVLAWFAVFCYWPIYWLKMAFFDQKVTGDIFVGFKHFADFFKGDALLLLKNTLAINFLALIFVFPAGIILALAFNEIRNKAFKKTVQIITYLPHFLSTAAFVGFIFTFLDSDIGPLAMIAENLNLKPISYLYEAKYFRAIQVISGIWQTAGWNSIVYTAALTSIAPELYEAGEIDGANKWQEIWKITIPSILPTIIIMFIFQIGSIMGSNFEKIYLMQNNSNIDVSEVIATFVYKRGIQDGNFGLATAVGVFNSIISLILVIASNVISKKLTDTSLW